RTRRGSSESSPPATGSRRRARSPTCRGSPPDSGPKRHPSRPPIAGGGSPAQTSGLLPGRGGHEGGYAGLKSTVATPPDKLLWPENLAQVAAGGCEGRYQGLTRYIV